MAAIRDSAYGGIAIDSIVLSPECRPSTGNPFSGLLTHHIISHLQRMRVNAFCGVMHLQSHILFLNSELYIGRVPQVS